MRTPFSIADKLKQPELTNGNYSQRLHQWNHFRHNVFKNEDESLSAPHVHSHRRKAPNQKFLLTYDGSLILELEEAPLPTQGTHFPGSLKVFQC